MIIIWLLHSIILCEKDNSFWRIQNLNSDISTNFSLVIKFVKIDNDPRFFYLTDKPHPLQLFFIR